MMCTQAVWDIGHWLLTWDNDNFASTPNYWAALSKEVATAYLQMMKG